jgi:hypothetical protein
VDVEFLVDAADIAAHAIHGKTEVVGNFPVP